MCLPDPWNTETCIEVACDASAADGSFCADSAAETGPVACAGLGLSGYEQTAYDMCCSTADDLCVYVRAHKQPRRSRLFKSQIHTYW